ncbi:unnamed protein product [Paramecium primaurelia]|uniref:Structural maintenance of chromosomes protein n=1 Tax=Paramecium primaurelia TaxID=5886 RepID=A0A8S1NX88_PARPR|nr:unnamed protein product [Paramecium primaurelia]
MSQLIGTLSLDTNAYVDYNISENMSNNALENSDLLKVRLGKIKGMKVCNFKSFENEHYIGPFTKFTSIIGPNGGGKSNVLDAIQFVLGISIRSMRCHRAEELIYSQSMYYKNYQEEDRSAYVELIFEAINYIETQISLKRTVNKQQQTQVYIGEQQVTEKELSSFLLLSKIILPAKNFIMLQGDTDTLTTIEPKKLTELFEYVSGSVQYKNTCQQIQSELNKVVIRMRELQFQRGAMRTEQKKVKELKNTSDKYKKINDEINQLKLKQKLFELKQIDNELEDISKQLTQNKNDESDQNSENKKLVEDIQQCDLEIEKLKQELNQIEENEKKIKKDEKSKAYDTTSIDLEIELLKKQVSTYEGLLSKLKKDINYQMEMIEEVQTDLDGKTQHLQKIKSQSNLKLSKKLMEEFQELQMKFKIQNQQIQSELEKLQEKQGVAQKIYDQIDDEIKQYTDDRKELIQAIEEQNTQLKYVKDEFDVLKDRHQNTQKRIDELYRQNQIEENELKSLQQHKIEQEKQLRLIEVQETENIDEKQTQLLIQQLKSMFKDFRGELSSLCNPDQQQFAIPLKVALGQRLLCALVVDSEKTAKEINMHLRSLDIVKELIILNRVKNNKDESELRENVEQFVQQYRRQTRAGKAYLAIDIIKYDQCLDKVLKSLLNGVVVCDSYQLAVQLQKEKIQDVKQIITLDGITLATSGMIVFNGSQQRLSEMRNFRSNNQRIQQKGPKESKEQLIKSIDDLQNKIKTLKNVSVQDDLKYHSALKMKLEEQQAQLSNKQIQFQKSIQMYNEKLKQVEKLLDELYIEINKRKVQLKEFDEQNEKLVNQIQNQQKVAYQDFAKRNSISLQDLNQLDFQQNLGKQLEMKQQQLNKLQVQKQSMEQYLEELKKKQEDFQTYIKTKIEAINNYEQKKIDLQQNHEKKNKDLVQYSHKQQEINQKLKTQQKRLLNLTDMRNQQVRKGVDKKQQINLINRKLEQLRFQRGRLIELCEIESIPVRFKRSQGTFQPSLNFDDDQQMDMEAIDYTAIKNDLKHSNWNKLIEEINVELEIKEQEITKYLSENLQVGLIGAKTDEKFVQLETNIESLGRSIKELQNREAELSDQLVQTQQLRKDRFDKLFDRVEKEIKILYQKLTENQNRVGGTVLLYMENKEEPFEGGLIYTPNPPNKKYIFDNSEQLSGGEKAIASIALLLALNAAIDAPFILLDEVDAHLDQDNADKLQKIVKLLSNQIQFVLVSHNPDVFAHSDSLVGVTIQHSKTTSEAFSLLL